MADPYPGAPDAIPELIAAYERQPDELAALVRGLTPAQLTARPVPGKWSTLEVIAHLADCDEVLADRLKRILAMDRPLLMGFDESRFAERLGYQARDMADELATMGVTRRRMGRIFRALSPDGWERQGVHSERGLLSVKQIARMAVGHVNHHVPFIREKLAAMK